MYKQIDRSTGSSLMYGAGPVVQNKAFNGMHPTFVDSRSETLANQQLVNVIQNKVNDSGAIDSWAKVLQRRSVQKIVETPPQVTQLQCDECDKDQSDSSVQLSATGVVQLAQDQSVCTRNLFCYNLNKMQSIEKKHGAVDDVVAAFLVHDPIGVPGHCSGKAKKKNKPNQATKDAVARFNVWYNATYGVKPKGGKSKRKRR